MDVVWLKKDLRLHDHAPFCEAAKSGRKFIVMYLYEPDQLAHHSVHGSHVNFANEGLADLDARLAAGAAAGAWSKDASADSSTLRSISCLRGEATACLEALHAAHGVARLLAHEETGHLASYARDRRVRRWYDAALYDAWAAGRTGFPMVDACMRCLLRHGWLNFRMRAMLVSFATYNLWLDWRRIAPHLARCFLDYEPGIHYPQLQMQAGTTGINAMRVYSVTKQAKDQDPRGTFIKRHVPELRAVPAKWCHEPSKMPAEVARACGFVVGTTYPRPVVDEKESAKRAKALVSAVKKLEATKIEARKVYEKHGSRARRDNAKDAASEERPTKRARAKPAALPPGQTTLNFASKPGRASPPRPREEEGDVAPPRPREDEVICLDDGPAPSWTCRACTFLNEKPHAPVCAVCETAR